MEYAEITEQAFNRLVSNDDKVSRVEELEHARKTYYSVHGINCLLIHNYLGNGNNGVWQYYIQDINA